MNPPPPAPLSPSLPEKNRCHAEGKQAPAHLSNHREGDENLHDTGQPQQLLSPDHFQKWAIVKNKLSNLSREERLCGLLLLATRHDIQINPGGVIEIFKEKGTEEDAAVKRDNETAPSHANGTCNYKVTYDDCKRWTRVIASGPPTIFIGHHGGTVRSVPICRHNSPQDTINVTWTAL